MQNIAIIGRSGAIGNALTAHLAALYTDAVIHGFSRIPKQQTHHNVLEHDINYQKEASIQKAAAIATKDKPLDLIIVATGILHEKEIMPEKSLRDLTADKLLHLFTANTIVPALIAKYFLPHLNRDKQAVFAALSARVGSITDNQLGGWYSYRASKTALNMVIKNAAIETARRHKEAVIIGLHPGTVDSRLSLPFQKQVPDGQLFTPDYAAEKLLSVIGQLSSQDSGKCFAWDGQEIAP